MLIVYDNLFVLEPEKPYGEKTRLTACVHSKIMICLDTTEFQVRYEDGKASVSLSRHLTNEQARELGKKLIFAADENDRLDEQYVAVTSSNQIPLPPGVNFEPAHVQVRAEVSEVIALRQTDDHDCDG